MKFLLSILVIVFMLSCGNKNVEIPHLTEQIKAFSAFYYRGDSVRKFYANTILFKHDSVVVFELGFNNNWTCSKVKIPKTAVDSFNQLLKEVNFKSLIGNTSIQSSCNDGTLYDGLYYGFIDSLGYADVFTPSALNESQYWAFGVLKKKLFYLKAEKSFDTTEVIQLMRKIKEKYDKVSPPPPRMEEAKIATNKNK